MRLINADALRKTEIVEERRIFKDGKLRKEKVYTEVYLVEEIDNAPTIEAVPVVRCKDCKHRTWFCPNYGCGNYNSPFYIGADEEVPIMTKPDDFCSYGEKKMDEKAV